MSAEPAAKPRVLNPRSETGARTLLRVSAIVTVVGIAVSAAGDPGLGRWFALGGVLSLVVGLHRFGRLGIDPPLEFGPDNAAHASAARDERDEA